VKALALLFGAVLLRFLFVSPFMLLFWWIRRSTKKLRPRDNGNSAEFSLAPRMHVLIEIVTVSLVAFTALIVLEAVRTGEGLYAALIPVSVLVAILLAEPRTVLINHEGIRQHRRLRGDRIIAWNEVAWMGGAAIPGLPTSRAETEVDRCRFRRCWLASRALSERSGSMLATSRWTNNSQGCPALAGNPRRAAAEASPCAVLSALAVTNPDLLLSLEQTVPGRSR
jgi:hypothetical protein